MYCLKCETRIKERPIINSDCEIQWPLLCKICHDIVLAKAEKETESERIHLGNGLVMIESEDGYLIFDEKFQTKKGA